MSAITLPASADRSRLRALLALFCGGVAIGASGIFVRWSETGTTATAFWRGALALPPLALWLLLRRRTSTHSGATGDSMRRGLRDWRVFWAGAFFAADIALWQGAVMLTSVATATLEACVAPLLVTLFAWLWWKVRPASGFIVALLLAFCGLVLIVAPNLMNRNAAITGDLLGLSAAAFYAGYLIMIARLRAAYETPVVMLLTTLAFSIVLLPLALSEQFLPKSFAGWMWLAALALIAQCIGQGLIAYALAHLPPTLGSMGIYMQPVAAAVYGWLLLGETLLPMQMVGGVITVTAIGLSALAGRSTLPRRLL